MLPVWKIDCTWLCFVRTLVGLLWVLPMSLVSVNGQSSPLVIQDALRVRTFGELMPIGFSPDGKWFAYTVTDRQRVKPEDGNKWIRAGRLRFVVGDDVFLSNVETGKTENLTKGEGDSWLPTWSPDGVSLAFLSDRLERGKARVWIWRMDRNELRQASDVSFLTTQMEWTPDSRHLALTTARSSDDSGRAGSGSSVTSPTPRSGDAHSTAVVYRSNGAKSDAAASSDPWDLDELRRDLAVLDVDTGRVTRLVSDERISVFRLSPDGARVAYSSPRTFVRAGSQQMIFDLCAVTLASQKTTVLARGVPLSYDGAGLSWSPDSRNIAFRHSGPDERVFDSYVVRVDGAPPRNVTAFAPREPRSNYESEIPLWDADSSGFYFTHEGAFWRASMSGSSAEQVAKVPGHAIKNLLSQSQGQLWTAKDRSTVVVAEDEQGKQEGVFRIEVKSGLVRLLLEDGECYSCLNVDEPMVPAKATGQIAFFREDAGHPRDLWLAEPDFQSPHRLTHLNPQFDSYEFGRARLVSWQSDDGEMLQGALLLPSGYREGMRYPLVVWVYGGELLSSFYDRFGLGHGGPLNWQLLATRGYAVLLPDAPVHVGTPMLDLAKSVLPAVSRIVDMGIADPARLGVAGHSYGGYSTVALIAETTRFHCAIEMDGFADLLSAYGEMSSSGASYFTAIAEQKGSHGMGGTPWDFRERYLENSPFLYLKRVETPLLIVHGSTDSAVSSFLGDQIFVALRRLNKEVEYAKYEGEDHSPNYWSYANQVDLDERMIRWFDTHLKQ
jgi:dipeptidyl aminopeptidase/acylaminoacyl peptidase